MFYYVINTLALIVSGIFCYKYYDSEYIHLKYGKWQSLNAMMATKYKSPLIVKIMSVYMIFKYFYLHLIQYLTDNVKKIDKNVYEITYIINGKVYKMRVKPTRGPSMYEKVINDKHENITDEVLAYFGPHYNNLVKLTPRNFNSQTLSFYCINGEHVTFESDEKISLS